MTMRRSILLPGLLLFSTALALPALATDPPAAKQAPVAKPTLSPKPPPSERAGDRVGALFDQAQAAFAKGDMQGALAAYQEAWALQKSYDIAGNMGNVELKLGMYRDAAKHLSFAFFNFPPTGDPALKQALLKKVWEVQDQVARIRVAVSEEGAEVWVNGKLAGTSQIGETLFLDPGEIVVEAKLSGYANARQALHLDKGGAKLVEMKLVPLPPPVVVTEKRSAVPAIVAGGLAVGAAAAGVGLFVASSGKRTDALALSNSIVHEDHQRCVGPGPIDQRCAELDSTARAASVLRDASVGMFVGAGVLAAGALTYLLWPAPKAKQAGIDIHAAPVLGTGHGGMIVGGTF